MTQKTRIYIDVDGVLNAFENKSAWDSPLQSTVVLGYLIKYSQEVIDALNDLHDHPDVEFVWLTTWQNHARLDLAPAIGLRNDWRALTSENCAPTGYIGFQNTSYWWKLEAIEKDLADSPVDKFVWIDDELSRRQGAQNWFNEVHAGANTGLLVSTNDATGLTPDDLCGIIDYINGPQG